MVVVIETFIEGPIPRLIACNANVLHADTNIAFSDSFI